MAKIPFGIQSRIDMAQYIALNVEAVNMMGKPVERADVRELAMQLVEIWTWIRNQSKEDRYGTQ
jgi:hypothetical protein